MIHTDGKPTIAHYPARESCDPYYNPMPEPPRKLPIGSLRRKLVDAEKRIRELEAELAGECSCADCAYDPDSAPGGYDNPSEPY